MNKGILIFIGLGIAAVYLVLGFLDKMGTSSELSTVEQKIQTQDMTYYRTDAIGQTVLYFSDESYSKKFEIWKRSPLHEEFFVLFPNFMAMKDFVSDRILDRSSVSSSPTLRRISPAGTPASISSCAESC